MITEISKFYIEGTGDPNANVIIDSGYPKMPVNYYDVSTEPITEYKFDDSLEPGTKWFVTNAPISGEKNYKLVIYADTGPTDIKMYDFYGNVNNQITVTRLNPGKYQLQSSLFQLGINSAPALFYTTSVMNESANEAYFYNITTTNSLVSGTLDITAVYYEVTAGEVTSADFEDIQPGEVTIAIEISLYTQYTPPGGGGEES